ncbi:gliding motility protein GldN [Flavobacterium sp. Sd200]|uniref:type IX secretion system ring protein PorN/GldN n=1 Tax=Flavobacterium sp. Sd200 TaxID=2692211 RepID=UPI00136D61B7|nr:gliding motility protein GldN [Flavobacterium sp. Sd200]MXN90990.1 gliding motility protein GldN [Flavobacterium sp. Sd200]
MNSRKFSVMAALFLGLATSYGQSNLLNAKTPDEIGKKTAAEDSLDNDKPLPYGYIGNRDVLFSKKIWETIDLNQRINYPLYFPTEDSGSGGNLGSDRKSLFNVLIEAIQGGKLTEVYDDSYFTTKKTLQDIEKSFFFEEINDLGITIYNRNQGLKKYKGMNEDEIKADLRKNGVLTDEHFTTSRLKPSDIAAYQIVGTWYFDKRQGELKYRILGLSPMGVDAFTKARATAGEDVQPISLFWIFYPGARDVLHKAKAFNDKNSTASITFDHLLNARRFSAVVTKEENIYGDRGIDEYLQENAQMQLLEAERVRDKIRNYEQDMWNY